MVVLYTDDCVWFSNTSGLSQKLVGNIKEYGFLPKYEVDTVDLLWVTINHNENVNLHTTQTGIIKYI